MNSGARFDAGPRTDEPGTEVKRALIVNNDSHDVDVLSHHLRREGYEVAVAREGREGLRRFQALRPDLVLLNLELPDVDGLELCRSIRSSPRGMDLPIVIVSAKVEEMDQVLGFAAGADDFVIKPFLVKVLLQRVKVLLRRTPPERSEILESGAIRLDKRGHQVMVYDLTVRLTPAEFRLLETLMRHPGRTFARRDLKDSPVCDATIEVQIKSLRHKLGESGSRIETVRGIGYRFQPGSS